MRKLFSFFMGDDGKDSKNSSAKVAKERLQILIAKDGGNGILSDDVLRKIEYEVMCCLKTLKNPTNRKVYDLIIKNEGKLN